MLEKRPGETDADHLADPACRALIKALIGLRANRGCGQPPDEADHGSRGQCRAGRAVEDRYKHVHAPPPYGEVRRKRSAAIGCHLSLLATIVFWAAFLAFIPAVQPPGHAFLVPMDSAPGRKRRGACRD